MGNSLSVFFADLTELGAEPSEFFLSKQYSQSSISPVSYTNLRVSQLAAPIPKVCCFSTWSWLRGENPWQGNLALLTKGMNFLEIAVGAVLWPDQVVLSIPFETWVGTEVVDSWAPGMGIGVETCESVRLVWTGKWAESWKWEKISWKIENGPRPEMEKKMVKK